MLELKILILESIALLFSVGALAVLRGIIEVYFGKDEHGIRFFVVNNEINKEKGTSKHGLISKLFINHRGQPAINKLISKGELAVQQFANDLVEACRTLGYTNYGWSNYKSNSNQLISKLIYHAFDCVNGYDVANLCLVNKYYASHLTKIDNLTKMGRCNFICNLAALQKLMSINTIAISSLLFHKFIMPKNFDNNENMEIRFMFTHGANRNQLKWKIKKILENVQAIEIGNLNFLDIIDFRIILGEKRTINPLQSLTISSTTTSFNLNGVCNAITWFLESDNFVVVSKIGVVICERSNCISRYGSFDSDETKSLTILGKISNNIQYSGNACFIFDNIGCLGAKSNGVLEIEHVEICTPHCSLLVSQKVLEDLRMTSKFKFLTLNSPSWGVLNLLRQFLYFTHGFNWLRRLTIEFPACSVISKMIICAALEWPFEADCVLDILVHDDNKLKNVFKLLLNIADCKDTINCKLLLRFNIVNTKDMSNTLIGEVNSNLISRAGSPKVLNWNIFETIPNVNFATSLLNDIKQELNENISLLNYSITPL